MAKVFTITEGLENMGALKTGGQGSVYKGRRTGEIITAIKILPTPLLSETASDKNYLSFANEVAKLKKVNEDPNPNVVKILSSGLTDSGNFPFIEMEFIEGPDLEELLKPPHNPVFTIKEVLKLADQLANALAHCHKADVKHGDIKSNNVKFNQHTGNYILLDFGLSIMSDEQRRTSFRNAGAIEFMAPEQMDGDMMFETDVYSYGVIIYELLAGVVPFPLKDNGETARNIVRLSHAETPPPNILHLRRKALPNTWSDEKKEYEMHVPEWLLSMVYKCLEKMPDHRFNNGVELCDYIARNSFITASKDEWVNERIAVLQQENERLIREKEQLQERLLQHQQNPNDVLANSFGINPHTAVSNPVAGVLKNHNRRNIFLAIGAALIICLVFFIYTLFSARNEDAASGSNTRTANTAVETTDEEKIQLKQAVALLKENKVDEALAIYKSLSTAEVPEAMYYYGKLALQNTNKAITCAEGFSLVKKAGDQGFTPAKRTLGILYLFADRDDVLEQHYFTRCQFSKNLTKGTKYLTQAMIQGDTAASRIIDSLNVKP
ncbi:MAG: protein kinase [Segetibacter sp.]|nr:protein kinase [Segetibacter sp.]